MGKLKRYKCPACGKDFATLRAAQQHERDKHGGLTLDREGAMAVLSDFDDLSDGAWMALAEELGVRPEDLI